MVTVVVVVVRRLGSDIDWFVVMNRKEEQEISGRHGSYL